MDETIALLTKMFENRDWFHSAGTDQYGRYVVYMKYLCEDNLSNVPDSLGGKQVLCHWAASKTATASQFINTPTRTVSASKFELVVEPEEELEELSSSF